MLDAAKLNGLLNELERDGFGIGLHERLNAQRLLASLVTSDIATAPSPVTRAMFAGILARSPEELTRFKVAFDNSFPQSQSEPETFPQENSARELPTVKPGALQNAAHFLKTQKEAAIAVLAATIFAAASYFYYSPNERGDAPKPTESNTVEVVVPAAETKIIKPGRKQAEGQGGPPTADQFFKNLAQSMPNEAPTLYELWQNGWPKIRENRHGNQLRFHQWLRETGLPPYQPMLLTPREGDALLAAGTMLGLAHAPESGTFAFSKPLIMSSISPDRQLWLISRVAALRVAMLEDRLLVATLRKPFTSRVADALLTQVKIALPAKVGLRGLDRALLLAFRYPAWEIDDAVETPRPGSKEYSQGASVAKQKGAPDGKYFHDAAWRKHYEATLKAPSWLAPLGVFIPLLLAAFSLARRGRNRKKYLYSRTPDLPPMLYDLVVEAPRKVSADTATAHKVAQGLQVRTSMPSDRIDPRATVEATIAAGGLFTRINGLIRPPPSYLALIETQGVEDMEAGRLNTLITRLEDADVAVDRYSYSGTASLCRPADGGPPVTLEQLAARKPNHRLILLGEGSSFLDPITFEPAIWTQTFAAWERRAMLTPIPMGEWGRLEFTLANALDMPLGRATNDGMLALAELLDLEQRGDRPLFRVYASGGSDGRAMPEILRAQSYRWTSPAVPNEDDWQELRQSLQLYLEPSGYLWLCALALYPVLQWDLSLYLGVNLKDDTGAPLYSEVNAAALTQLPWLREGRMPPWLRRKLTEPSEMPPEQRSEATRLLWQLLRGEARNEKTNEPIKLKLARTPAAAAARPYEADQPLKDETFVELLAEEEIPDLALELPRLGKDSHLRRWLSRWSWPDVQTIFGALVLSLTAWIVAPGTTGEMPIQTYAPLFLLGVVALVGWRLAQWIVDPYRPPKKHLRRLPRNSKSFVFQIHQRNFERRCVFAEEMEAEWRS